MNNQEINLTNGFICSLLADAYENIKYEPDVIIFSDEIEGSWNLDALPEDWDFSNQIGYICGDSIAAANNYFRNYIGTSQIFYALQSNTTVSRWAPPHFIVNQNNIIQKRVDSVGTSGFYFFVPINHLDSVNKITLQFRISNNSGSWSYGRIGLGKIENGEIVSVYATDAMRNTSFQETVIELAEPVDVDYIYFQIVAFVLPID